MSAIIHKLIDTVSEVIRLYIRTRFIKNPGSVAITAGLFILSLLFGANYAAKIGLNLTWLQVDATTNTQSISPLWESAFLY